MRRMRRAVVLSAAALMALAAWTCAPARADFNALPELGRCVPAPLHLGRYKLANCVSVSPRRTGAYEFLPGAAEHHDFTAAIAEATLQAPAGAGMACGGGEATGEWRGDEVGFGFTEGPVTLRVMLRGCRDEAGAACESSPAVPGVVTSSALEGTQGFIKDLEQPPPLEGGIDLTPEEPSRTVMSFTCGAPDEPGGAQVWTVEGSVIAKVAPLDVMTSVFRLTVRARGASQIPEALRGEAPNTLMATRIGEAGMSTEAAGLTLRGEHRPVYAVGEERLEFKARVR
jgi:hypothetical protein